MNFIKLFPFTAKNIYVVLAFFERKDKAQMNFPM